MGPVWANVGWRPCVFCCESVAWAHSVLAARFLRLVVGRFVSGIMISQETVGGCAVIMRERPR